MSQFVLDDQLDPRGVRDPITRWSTVRFLREVRPGGVVKDDRVPVVLRTLRMPTFISIDAGFYKRTGRDRHLCILYFALRADDQDEIPALLRRLLHQPDFRTRAARMGKVARVSRDRVSWWQIGDEVEHTIDWRSRSHRRTGR